MASDLWVDLTDYFIQPIEPFTDLRCTKQFLPNDVDIWKHQNKHANTPTGARPYFEISAPHVRTHPWQWQSQKQVKMALRYKMALRILSIFKQKLT